MAAPALPYPEWRTEVVHRARRYGMREAGRPLELAMYGWGRDFVETETSAVYAKMRRKEEANRQRLRQSISLLNESVKSLSTAPAWEGSTSDQDNEGDKAEDEAEAEDGFEGEARTGKGWDKVESKRRMSTVSHVSTIKAKHDGSMANTTAIQTTEEDEPENRIEDDSDAGTEKATDDSDSDAIGKFGDDEFEGGYAYGLDDEEEALAEGLGSIMNDSEEESEVEWFAWTTDLPRQVLARQQHAELDRIKEQKLREERAFSDFESQPLSPMEFSNPFQGDNTSFISQSIALPTVLPPIPPPKTPEEERRQYAEKRRKLEPSAISTSALPPMPSLPASLRLLTANHPSSSSLQSNQHTRMPSTSFAQGGYHAQRLSNHSAPLSSPSSTESLGFSRQGRIVSGAAPLNVGAANSSRNQSNPVSPLWGMFSPIDDEFGPPSSSTTPPSATGVYTYGSQAHRRAHSRSISGSGPGDDEGDSSTLRPGRMTLHHSISMPFAGTSNAQTMSTASSPHSPTRISAGKTLTQPISMPILTPAQISQIESELEEKMANNTQMRRLDAGTSSLAPSPSTSPPSSSYSHFSPRESSLGSHGPARRSSSAGLVPPGSPPSSSGLGSSIGRSASVLVRPLPTQADERTQERDPSPTTKQRPTLSMTGVSSMSSTQLADAQSPTQRRYPRGPRSAYPEAQDIDEDGAYNVGPSGAPNSKYKSAKALLRRVRSGSSLGMDSRIDEVSPHAEAAQSAWPPISPPSSVITSATGTDGIGSTSRLPDTSTTPSRKKMGTLDRIVRGLDSALEFVEGR